MIESISFLTKSEERRIVKSREGKFSTWVTFGTKTKTQSMTAAQFVKHYRDMDPYITLDNGDKMRVYRGGNPTDFVIETISMIEVHDSKFEKRDKKEKKAIIPEYPDYYDFEDY